MRSTRTRKPRSRTSCASTRCCTHAGCWARSTTRSRRRNAPFLASDATAVGRSHDLTASGPRASLRHSLRRCDRSSSGGLDMIRLLAVVLTLLAVASAVIPFPSTAGAAAKGKLVLAWHAGFASRWLDPQEHDGTATPDNFFTALHDALIKNQGPQLYDHLALAEKFAVAPDAKSATFTLRKGIKFHNGDPVTPQDVKFSYENYRGAKADVV